MFTTGALITGVFVAVVMGSWWTALAVVEGRPIDTLLRFLVAIVVGGALATLLREQLRIQRWARSRR